jgi:predicted nucleic acid-binding protein
VAYLIDTNVAICLRDADAGVTGKVAKLEGEILLSVVTRVELEGGVYRDATQAGVRRARVDALLRAFPVLAFDDASADAYRGIVETVGFSRRKIIDRMIAAQALVHRLTLITLNGGDFADVPGLEIVAW